MIYEYLGKPQPMIGGIITEFPDKAIPYPAIHYPTNESRYHDQTQIPSTWIEKTKMYSATIPTEQSNGSYVAKIGVYVDVTFYMTEDTILTKDKNGEPYLDYPPIRSDFVPQPAYYFLQASSRIILEDTNSKQKQEASFALTNYANYNEGYLLSYELIETEEPDIYHARLNYRFWLCSNMEFVLGSTAKLYYDILHYNTYTEPRTTGYLYLFFDNLPYLVYPKTINDIDTFSIEYSVPNANKINYIRFGLLDADGYPLIDYRTASKSEVFYSFTLTEADKEKLYAKYNTVNTANVNLVIQYQHYNEDPTSIAYPITFEIIKAPPVLEVISLTDENNIIPNSDEVFVNLLSSLRVVVNPIAYKGASITYYTIENSEQRFENQSDVLFPSVTTKRVWLYAEDSRGNKFNSEIALDGWIPYISPTCSISVEPPRTDGTIRVTMSGQYFGNYYSFENSYRIYYQYGSNIKENSVGYTLLRPTPSLTVDTYNRFTTTFSIPVPDHAATYTVQIKLVDNYRSAESNSMTVKSDPVFDWSRDDFNFNVPVTIKGDLVVTGSIASNTPAAVVEDPAADYIIEQSTKTTGSGNSTANWVYRKWNSGIAECWCRKHIQTGVSTAWGGLYVSGALPHTNIVWPINFIDIPVANITIAPNASGAFLIAGGSTNLTATNTGGYEIARGTSLSSGNFYINYYGIGQWK